jgi:hypothetical protein
METLDIVYIFTNRGMPGLCKIGYTSRNDVKERAKELYTTGVPYPFQIYYACQVVNGKKIEKTLHKLFDEQRVNDNREFFETEPEKVILALQLASPVDVTPRETEYLTTDEIKEIQNVEKKRLSNFTFEQANIPIDIYIGRYERDYNLYDVSYAITICSMLGVEFEIIDFNHFFNGSKADTCAFTYDDFIFKRRGIDPFK